MKVTFLGTNGWYDTKTGNTICILIETDKAYIVFDAGNGIYKIDNHIRSQKPIYLFISHMHLDHVTGLHIFNKFKFKQSINIIIPLSLKSTLQKLISRPITIPLNKLPFKVRVNTFDRKINAPFSIQAFKLNHPSPCWGYRLETEGKIIAYGVDTGRCKNLYLLAKNADLFIAECSYRKGEIHKGWIHLNPEQAAEVAKQAKTKKLALVHFDASRYLTFRDRQQAEKAAQVIFKNTFAARDNLKIKL
jgi:ribonuclease BN (tRNA processing enzyme)